MRPKTTRTLIAFLTCTTLCSVFGTTHASQGDSQTDRRDIVLLGSFFTPPSQEGLSLAILLQNEFERSGDRVSVVESTAFRHDLASSIEAFQSALERLRRPVAIYHLRPEFVFELYVNEQTDTGANFVPDHGVLSSDQRDFMRLQTGWRLFTSSFSKRERWKALTKPMLNGLEKVNQLVQSRDGKLIVTWTPADVHIAGNFESTGYLAHPLLTLLMPEVKIPSFWLEDELVSKKIPLVYIAQASGTKETHVRQLADLTEDAKSDIARVLHEKISMNSGSEVKQIRPRSFDRFRDEPNRSFD